MAFRAGNREEGRTTQGHLKVKIREAKETYMRNLEQKLQQNNMRGLEGNEDHHWIQVSLQ